MKLIFGISVDKSKLVEVVDCGAEGSDRTAKLSASEQHIFTGDIQL